MLQRLSNNINIHIIYVCMYVGQFCQTNLILLCHFCQTNLILSDHFL